MRLINVETLELEDFVSRQIPAYAVLSHTWDGDNEVSCQEWLLATAPEAPPQALDRIAAKTGYTKITSAAATAKRLGCGYLWADTACIDKSSSAELSEAINSMYAWYRRSKVCLVHLSDVNAVPSPDEPGGTGAGPDLEASRWFRRGWTLQELLAPRRLLFYSHDWHQVGTGSTLEKRLTVISGISAIYIRKDTPLWAASVAEKLSWLAGRQTTREEDMAYCMLGILRINMPLLYGEGSRAFIRLQEEIIRRTNDHSIFCWRGADLDETSSNNRHEVPNILATSPSQFFPSSSSSSSSFSPTLTDPAALSVDFSSKRGHNPAFAWTNAGLNIELPIIHCYRSHYIVLDATLPTARDVDYRLCLPIDGSLRRGIVGRAKVAAGPIIMPTTWAPTFKNLYFPPNPEKFISSPPRPEVSFPWGALITFNKPCGGSYPTVMSVDVLSIADPNDVNLAMRNYFDPHSSIVELKSPSAPSSAAAAAAAAESSASTPANLSLDDTGVTAANTYNLTHTDHETMLLLTTPSQLFLIWLGVREHALSSDLSNPPPGVSTKIDDTTAEPDRVLNYVHYVFSPAREARELRRMCLLEKHEFLRRRESGEVVDHEDVKVVWGPRGRVEGIEYLIPVQLVLAERLYGG